MKETNITKLLTYLKDKNKIIIIIIITTIINIQKLQNKKWNKSKKSL